MHLREAWFKELIAYFMFQLRKDVHGRPLNVVNDPDLPICWKGTKPFKLVSDVKNYFSTLALSFTRSKNVQLQLPPEAYLIVTVSTETNIFRNLM